MYDILFISNGTKSDVAWQELKNRFPRAQRLENVDSFEYIKNKSLTRFFYVVWDDVIVSPDFNFDYKIPVWDEQYMHVFNNEYYYDGICLLSKDHNVSQKELFNRIFFPKKDIDIKASMPRDLEYDILFISNGQKSDTAWIELEKRFPKAKRLENVDSFESVKNKSDTKFFYVVWDDIVISSDFNFDYRVPVWDEKYLHVFNNEYYYDGICLLSKEHEVSKREFFNRFFFGKKDIDIKASSPRPLEFDIIFISYHETNADQNFQKLRSRFPNAKRIDGIKGIHQAHKTAAMGVTTEMFYVVDGDAEIVDDFKFDFYVPTYQRDIPHVWHSINPINNLEYGYGGVKLLPTDKVINMPTDTVDMTLSISDKFKVVPQISNITRFNTDDFNAWKSAFRECVKLSTKPVTENYDDETDRRLSVWCSVGEHNPYGKIAIEGAISGKKFGYANIHNAEQLSKINDFDWLKSLYEQRSKNINT